MSPSLDPRPVCGTTASARATALAANPGGHAVRGAWWTRLGRLAIVSLLALGGCGGGVDSGGTGAPESLASGPITGLGSIIVGGVRFDVDSASIVDQDGRTLTSDQLQVGMSVELDGSAITAAAGAASATATALTVHTRSEIVGVVDAVNRLGTAMTVLGQPVRVTVATWFDDALAGGLNKVVAGEVVEVWGEYNARTGEYVATRIAPRAAAAYELRGPLVAVDVAAQTIVVGGLTIDISAIPAAAQPSLQVGRFVRVGLATAPAAGVWTATSLTSGNGVLPDRDAVRWVGRISALTSATQFVVNGLIVDATAATVSGDSAGVALGARVAIVGSTHGGVLDATGVDVLGDETTSNSTFEVHGAVTALDAAQGTLQLRGITVHLGSGVAYAGGSAADLALGKRIDVVGTLSGDGAGIDAETITFE